MPCLLVLFRGIRQKSHVKAPYEPNSTPPPENQHDNGKSPFLGGDTSSNGWVSIVMLVFRGLSRFQQAVLTEVHGVASTSGLGCLTELLATNP